MSADRWNEALEAAAKACERWADKYRLSTTHRTDDLVAAAMMCSQAILALREADQRGAAARELPAANSARCDEGNPSSAGTPSLLTSAKQPAQSAPHHPGGQEKAVSDTPRTDAAAVMVTDKAKKHLCEPSWAEGVNADFARTLERENAALRERIAELDGVREDAKRWQRLCELWAASIDLRLRQDEEGTWSITQLEDAEGEVFQMLVGDTPDAAIDAARGKP